MRNRIKAGIAKFILSNKDTMVEKEFNKYIMSLRYLKNTHYELNTVKSAFGDIQVVAFYDKVTFDSKGITSIIMVG